MTGICCPKCGEKEQRIQPWPVGRSTWFDHGPIKIYPKGHELPLFSRRAMELASGLSACCF